MKHLRLFGLLWAGLPGLPSGVAARAPDVELDAAAAIALAKTIPLLAVNLNNYKHPANPILAAGAMGDWDAGGIERVAVIRLGTGDWRMWYANAGPGRHSLGLATSPDGVSWTKYAGNPVFSPTEAWEEDYLSPTIVLQVNGRFYLYYWSPGHVFPDRTTGKLPPPKMKYIALVTSDDGINWTRQGNLDGRPGAVLGPEPPGINEHAAARGSGVDAAKVFYLPEERTRPWRMIYTAFGRHGQWNGLAESDDGITWHRTRAPVAEHSGTYTRATGNHHDSGQTIRCPLRIGNVWVGLSFELDARDSAPMVGLALDRWVTLGRRTLYRNQDYEQGALHPWSAEADEEWIHLYYSTGRRELGLVRAPKRSVHQPIVVWSKRDVGATGELSRIFEPDRRPVALQVHSDRDRDLRFVVWNPATADWIEVAPAPVAGGSLFTLTALPPHAKLRVRFTPRHGGARVSAWLVPQ
ncbi:MAG: hypothetical protein HZC55_21195 [Verrucomicrobia bacterium]|nr:hypothetical protein [Verrucomicrobiota bacterium]